MIVSIAIVFFVSWLPLNIFDLLMKIDSKILKDVIAERETIIYALLQLFGMCTAIANPILYGYLNENFRKHYGTLYRHMPWHAASEAEPMEVALRYQINMKRRPGDGKSSEEETGELSSAVITIDNYNNVNIVG